MNLIKKDVQDYFSENFGNERGSVYASPGRINLIA